MSRNMSLLEDKVAGNEHFAAGRYQQALECYSKAILREESFPTNEGLLVNCLSNRAACYLKIGVDAETEKKEEALQNCINDCGRGLEIRPDLLKALFRRAQAYLLLDNILDGINDLKALLRIDPGNKEAKKSLRLAREKAERIHVGKSEVVKVIRSLQSGKGYNGITLQGVDILNSIKTPGLSM